MQKHLTLSLVVASLLALSACSKKESSEGAAGAGTPQAEAMGEVLLTIGGKPSITTKELEEYYEQVLEQQPQLKSFAQFMPDLKENVFNTLVSQKMIEYWADDKKIADSKEYQQDYDNALINIKRGLAIKFFQQEHPVSISDSDVRKFYEEHKATMYASTPAGVSASGVSFDSEAAARAFLAKAQAPKADLTKLAQEANLSARNFGRVNETSQHIDKALLDKILAIHKFPSVQLVKVNNTFWVVEAKGKEEAKYYPFEQAKEDAHQRLNAERMGKMFNDEIAKLKSQYGVVENKAYFAPKKEDDKKAEPVAVAPAQAEAAKPAVA